MSVDKGLLAEDKSSTYSHLFDLNATPGFESQRPFPIHKSMHYLSLVKQQMVQQVLSFRGSCQERKAVSMSSHRHMKRCWEDHSMELSPLHPGFAKTKSINSRDSAQLQGCSLLTPSEVEGSQPQASRPPSPATTPHKQSFTQLTIFYNGTVNAYNVPADKAQSIMNMLAGNDNAHRLDSVPNIDERETYTAKSGSSSSPAIWKAESTNEQKEASIALPTERSTAQGIKEIGELRGGKISDKVHLWRRLEHEKSLLIEFYASRCSGSSVGEKAIFATFCRKAADEIKKRCPVHDKLRAGAVNWYNGRQNSDKLFGLFVVGEADATILQTTDKEGVSC